MNPVSWASEALLAFASQGALELLAWSWTTVQRVSLH
jgi:hypothetical protein